MIVTEPRIDREHMIPTRLLFTAVLAHSAYGAEVAFFKLEVFSFMARYASWKLEWEMKNKN